MAYVSQDLKKKLAVTVKAICKTYGVKASLSVNHHSTLVLTVKSGPIDFIGNFNEVFRSRPHPEYVREVTGNCLDVNVYWYKEHFSGRALAFLTKVIAAMNVGNWDESDIQSDYFNVGWYVDVKIGKWNKPYVLTK
jgi:hypothetical protein